MPSTSEAPNLRAAIAREQTKYWWRLFWETAPTRQELDRREQMWFWWGSIGWQAEVAARTLKRLAERSAAFER